MRYEKQQYDFDCLPTCFANCLDVNVSDIYEYIGHDGSEIWFPDQEGWRQHRNFHPQELMDFAFLMHGVRPMWIEKRPIGGWDGVDVVHIKNYKERFKRYLSDNKAVIMQPNHAVCWDGIDQYDPRSGSFNPLDDLLAEIAIIL